MAENLNSDTWVQEQLTSRGMEDTPGNRRVLRDEYYRTKPYAQTDITARENAAKAASQKQSGTGTATTAKTQATTGAAGLDAAAAQAAASSAVGPFQETNYVFPSRRINYSNENISMAETKGKGSFTSVRTPTGTISYYDGDLLVNEKNDIERPQYDANGGDLLSEYSSILNPVERNSLLTTLKDYGFYGDQKPSELAKSGRGLMNTDEAAFQKFLNYSSGNGRTWRAMLPIIQGQAKLVTGGSGRTVSVVSTEDATRVFREESLRLLGRMPTAQEIRSAVGAIQATERSRGAGGSMDAPSLATAAQEQAKKASPTDRTAQSTGQAINQIFALLGGR